uniref:Uncharacterized protein n=1 Tax=Pseudomonas phage Cygsa01 TaxID=3138529 RepID=A0AAU6W368_9VIRU
MQQKHTIAAEYPAYVVKNRAEIDGVLWITVEDKLCLANDHMSHFQAGSVVRYAQQYDECPITAVKRAQERGHATHWINSLSASITSHKRERESYICVSVGQTVRFEGQHFIITAEPNRNLGLKPHSLLKEHN